MGAADGGPVRIGNRYSIQECIGVGAMGAVWRATDELLGRMVAVKELLVVTPGTSGGGDQSGEQVSIQVPGAAEPGQLARIAGLFDIESNCHDTGESITVIWLTRRE